MWLEVGQSLTGLEPLGESQHFTCRWEPLNGSSTGEIEVLLSDKGLFAPFFSLHCGRSKGSRRKRGGWLVRPEMPLVPRESDMGGLECPRPCLLPREI